MPFGAQLEGGGVRFRLWAPADKRVDLLIVQPDSAVLSEHAAERDADGWCDVVVPGAGAGTRYQWRIDGELRVPDPASRCNPDGVHGPSCVVDPEAFAWDRQWTGRPWSEVVLYELHIGSFTPEGTFAAARGKLQALADLGVTAIELMPLADFPGRFGWGYDGVLPYAPHAAYGTPEDLKELIQAAHRLGLMVFLDVVYNHFGPDGNYLSVYAPDVFSRTHSNPWGASLNFDGERSQPVRQFFIHNALYWLDEYRFDGLRLDAIHAIVDGSAEHVITQLGRTVRERIPHRHVHLVLENENNGGEFLSATPTEGDSPPYNGQWNDDFHHAMHVLLTGEQAGYYGDYAERPVALVAHSLTHGYIWKASSRTEAGLRKVLEHLPAQPLGAMVNCITNHDQSGNRAFGERISRLMPAEALPVATALCLLTPATPMIFFGDEFGATTPFLYFADWEGDLKKAVTEGRMREFGHLNAKALGDGSGGVPPPCEASTFEASKLDWAHAESPAGMAWREFVTGLLTARRNVIAAHAPKLRTGAHAAHVGDGTALVVRWRYQDGRTLELRANLGPAAQDALTTGWAPLTEPETIMEIGAQDEAQWSPWSARWVWGHEPAAADAPASESSSSTEVNA